MPEGLGGLEGVLHTPANKAPDAKGFAVNVASAFDSPSASTSPPS
jgi:hypothetical protein